MENQTIKHLSNFNEMLYQRLQDVEHRLERLKIISSSLGVNDFSEITNQISKLESDIASIRQSINTNNINITNLSSTVENNSNSISLNSNNIQNLQTITNSHSSQLNAHDQQLQTIDFETIQENQQKLTNLETEFQTTTNNINNIDEKISLIHNNLSDLTTIRDRSLTNEVNITALSTNFTNFQSELDTELYIKFDKANQNIASVQTTANENALKITSLSSDVTTNKQDIQIISQNVQELIQTNPKNELSFILNGTYILQSDVENILNGTYTI